MAVGVLYWDLPQMAVAHRTFKPVQSLRRSASTLLFRQQIPALLSPAAAEAAVKISSTWEEPAVMLAPSTRSRDLELVVLVRTSVPVVVDLRVTWVTPLRLQRGDRGVRRVVASAGKVPLEMAESVETLTVT